jgi:putative SOS response-associated peptidase YedK
MSFQYLAPTNRELFRWQYGATAPAELGPTEVEPGGKAVFICRDPKSDPEADPRLTRLAMLGRYGLPTPWQQNPYADRKYLCTARIETAAASKEFSKVWASGRHCIVPLQSLERSRRVQWRLEKMRISSRDDESLGVAGLWSVGKTFSGAAIYSFALLSIGAETDLIMRNFKYENQQPRMPLFVHRSQYDAWLDAPPQKSMALIPNLRTVALKATSTKEKSSSF